MASANAVGEQPGVRLRGQAEAIAAAFRGARLAARALAAFPEEMPKSLAGAYQVQDAAIAGWDDRVSGWKVAGIQPQFRVALGADRLSGPVFARDTRIFKAGEITRFGVFPGGFAAIEAEFILRIGADIPPDAAGDLPRLARHVVALHAGMETAGSPFAAINELGPLSVVSDFGNNAGIIVGPEIANWDKRPLEDLTSRAFVNDRCVGEGSAAKVADGPLAALSFLVSNLAMRGKILRAGDIVSSGMTTGIHMVEAGTIVRLEFCDGIAFDAVAVKETGRPAA